MIEGKKILITGHTGNLAGTMAQALVEKNELWGLARYSAPGQREYWDKVGLRTVVGDYAKNQFADLPGDFDYVIHAAVENHPKTSDLAMQANAEGVGFLMHHCRGSGAFLHVSTIGVYHKQGPDHVYEEDDQLGGGSIGHYTGSKLAGEGVARTLCLLHGLPTIICRMAVQYGHFSQGGMAGLILRNLLEGEAFPLRRDWPNKQCLVSNDDVVRFIEPSLAAASVPATIIHWGGDENVPTVDLITYLAELAGVEPRWRECGDEEGWPSFPITNARRKAITGPCQVQWRDGIKRLYEALHEGFRADIAAGR